MGRKVFLSFLGTGNYQCSEYSINNLKAKPSKFVQVAELELRGINYFDRIIILITKSSKLKHWNDLYNEFIDLGVDKKIIDNIIVTEELEAMHQWSWFEEVLKNIELNDELTFDLTHGFRVMPIVLSTAINFLKKIKNIELKAVYYGAFTDKNKETTPIVDLKEFYIINEWTDAVSRLIEDADARKLAEVSQKEENLQLPELNNKELIEAFEDLTNSIRNVDIQRIGKKAENALKIIEKYKENASTTSKLMLDAVWDKFLGISINTEKYDKRYFKLQLKIIELLLDHKLYMQAFTVMREMVVSIAHKEIFEIIASLDNINSKKRRNLKKGSRRRFAEKFIAMIVIPNEKWDFSMEGRFETILLPVYKKFEEINVIDILIKFLKELTDIRNGFDHAWTSKSMKDNIDTDGKSYLEELKKVIDLLIENEILI